MKTCRFCLREGEAILFSLALKSPDVCLDCVNRRSRKGNNKSFYKYCWSHYGKDVSDVFNSPHSQEGVAFHKKIVEVFYECQDESALIDYFLDPEGDDILFNIEDSMSGDRHTIYLHEKLRSRNESFLATHLKSYCRKKYLSTMVEYRVLKNPRTDRYLPFDIYIDEYRLYIEINGEQHYKYVEYWHRNEDSFLRSQFLDEMKRSFAISDGHFLEIPVQTYRDDFSLAESLIVEKIDEISSFA